MIQPMPLIPHRFLFRVAHPCRYVKAMPQRRADWLLDLAEVCRIDNFAAMDERRNFADVRLAWNELGLGVQVEVRGKEKPPQGDVARPRRSLALRWRRRRPHRPSRQPILPSISPAGIRRRAGARRTGLRADQNQSRSGGRSVRAAAQHRSAATLQGKRLHSRSVSSRGGA